LQESSRSHQHQYSQACRWSPAAYFDMLHQLVANVYAVPHLCTLMGYAIKSLAAHRIPTEDEPEGRIHCSGHCRRG
jgi:hypothetical protein